ncbi:23S rRNA (pseudouridine(1915)-N(3))-methyltransferase RlmH [Brevundimonas sp. 2R-24]|uniref:Ribosomal RNA large subunit methyltransferase H n=1 Tax=Peiella sedimenti TaxID=3061083 RepID=A0ABT8SRJ1_9CAUL|nr:23S rRNA (pseudouridine(1915)-N(3))-methyltransferase RlmH [Caulobacteraceae bacterium XZ-24]
MRILILAIGRLGRGPEADLVRLYLDRATAAGRALGLGPVEQVEIEPRKPGKAAEAEAILAALPERAVLIACDERGRTLASRAFAGRIEALRDQGERTLVFVIGGADGLDQTVRDPARELLAFGPQTWPHALARVMLAEQVYRAVTILSGSPYHRD